MLSYSIAEPDNAFPKGRTGGGRFFAVGMAAVGLATVLGCSDGLPNMKPIKGEVFYNGEPLAAGRVVYLPAGEGRQASGPIKPDGTFVLTTQKAGDGAMFGDYSIVVYCRGQAGATFNSREAAEKAMRTKNGSVIPERYMDPAASGLSDSVDASHSGFMKLELTD